MDFITETFARMNLRQLRSFLLTGTEEYRDGLPSYRESLQKASDPIYKRLEAIYPVGAERDNATADLSDALTVHEAVYMELGMKAGARLAYQLLISDDSSREKAEAT